MDGERNVAIDWRPIGELIPYARNARTHSEAQVALIAGLIRWRSTGRSCFTRCPRIPNAC